MLPGSVSVFHKNDHLFPKALKVNYCLFVIHASIRKVCFHPIRSHHSYR